MLMEGCSITDETIFDRNIPWLLLTHDIDFVADTLLELIKEDKKNFVEWICFVDTFERNSPIFKKATQVHRKLFNEKEYKDLFYWVVKISESKKDKYKWPEVCPEIYKVYKDYLKNINY